MPLFPNKVLADIVALHRRGATEDALRVVAENLARHPLVPGIYNI
jgi:hypothetical protein